MLPAVALVGRPNVGKSTLFNAITNTRDALVADEPGVTRDRHYGVCRSAARPFVVVDTGGLTDDRELLAELTVRQSLAAVDEAALAVFVVDAKDGMTAADETILAQLRRYGRPIILAVNKTDGRDLQASINEFSALGLARVLPMAASHRRGVPELLEAIDELLPEDVDAEELPDEAGVRVAIIGRPNVGKSTLVNRLLGEERVIASEVPGTTRDAIEVPLHRDGRDYVLIDTAGVRRKGRVEEAIEKFSVIKTLQALERAHVAVLMVDAAEGVTDQDASVLGYALDAGRALVVCVNKWDGLSEYQRDRCESELARRLDFVQWAERIVISAKHGSGLRELVAAVDRAYASSIIDLGASEVTKAVEIAVESFQPPMVSGKVAKIRYAHMGGRNPPRIVLHGSRLDSLPASYVRYLENFMRRRYKLVGTPVVIETRAGANPFAGKKNVLTEKQVQSRRRMMRHVKRR
ncbi:MAG: ribosome biogenesis GTPase Der [Rhodanobacteraceae bacterium]|jgi:GTP-binding protein|nr:ribosome biogenesis GTPase Der [Rhodanobacteraceae bacterium]MBL0041463.1 ribosome biogenesis GTPase Der [Xanthomonadales bacterium]MBP6078923.1 ribosome biogenesis GTPase Der [Xanthomonadales bacterium]